MQIRADIHIGDSSRKIVFVGQDNETLEHMALKLAAFILFFRHNPSIEVSSKNPLMQGQEFMPDLICLNEAGEIAIWIECGNVATHKLDKIIRRNRQARIVVIKSTEKEAQNLRDAFEKNEIKNSDRIEIYAFPPGLSREWENAVSQTVDVYGEDLDRSFNLVANAVPFSFDFIRM